MVDIGAWPRWRRAVAVTVCVVTSAAIVPRVLCGWTAGAYYDGEFEVQDALARAVIRELDAAPPHELYRTRYLRFNGQSAVAAHQMAVLGLGQILLQHPKKRDEYLPAMRLAAGRLVDPTTLKYAARVYGHHGVTRMGDGEGHAYLGYINLALGMLRLHEPNTPHAALHDRLTRELASRLAASSTGLIETYPGETWPPDVAAVAGSIGLHATATGIDRSELLEDWAARFAACAIDESGYLVQRVESGGCDPVDAPRGSGTAVAAYFLSFAHPALSERLHEGLAREGSRSLLGFGGICEYATGFSGRGDTNAGPIVLGISMGATGFGLGSARAHGDRELFLCLYRTTHLFGVPVERDKESRFAMGGTLGNSLLLAMLTARTP